MYSCYCLHDVCCLSVSKGENLTQLSKRIELYMRKKYNRLLEEGLCSCCHCKPLNYICKYAVCSYFTSNKLKNIFIGEYEELKMNSHCERKDNFLKSIGTYPCCFNYYRTRLLDAAFFCTNCKVFLSSLSDFQLKKISLIK